MPSPWFVQNVGVTERIGSAAAGALLLLPLLKTRSAWACTGAAAGALLLYRGVTGHSPIYQALKVDRSTPDEPVRATASVTVGKSAQELYKLWQQPEVFAAVMRDFATLTPLDNDHARWTVHLPAGKTLAWETEVVEERRNELFAWQTVPGAAIPQSGKLHLRPAIPADRGTVTTLELAFDPSTLPGGTLLRGVSSAAETLARGAVSKMLRNFKALAESGEIPTLEGNPSGRGGSEGRKGDLL